MFKSKQLCTIVQYIQISNMDALQFRCEKNSTHINSINISMWYAQNALRTESESEREKGKSNATITFSFHRPKFLI